MVDEARNLAVENLYKLIFRNELNKKSIRDISYLIWSIDHFGAKSPDAEIRVGIEIPWYDDFQELVFRFNGDVFWIGVEGIQRSLAGSDSYQIEYFKGYSDWSFENDAGGRFEGDGILAFGALFEELLQLKKVKVQTEYWGNYMIYYINR